MVGRVRCVYECCSLSLRRTRRVARRRPCRVALHSASALEQSMGRKATVEQLQQLGSSDDTRFSATVQRVRQLSTVAEVVLRLEGLRDA